MRRRTCFAFTGLVVAACWTLLSTVSLAAGPKTGRVLIIGMDGTRPDALAKAKTPHIDQLITKGAFTDTAQILGERYDKNNTISGPGWSSILTGVWADKHGVHDNSFKGRNYEQFPHFFKNLKRLKPDAYTVSLVAWSPIKEFIVEEADVDEYFTINRGPNQLVDLKASGDKVQANTRDGKWHHLLATRKDGVVSLYLDGQLAAKVEAFNDQFDLEGKSYFLGRDTRSGATAFDGNLADIRLWQRALSADEVRSLASQSGKAETSREGLLAEILCSSEGKNGNGRILANSVGPASGVGNATAVSKTAGLEFAAADDSNGPKAGSLKLAGKENKDSGARLPLEEPLKKITRGDFTIETRFRTTDEGRNILMGNYGKGAACLNLELHDKNQVRLYLQPPAPAAKKDPADNKTEAPNGEQARDSKIAESAAKILGEADPTAMFVYFHQVDAAGHGKGFSPDVPEYVKAIENVDGNIGTVLKALHARPKYAEENWIVIVCTDHGGYLKGHGDGHDKPEIRQVFLIVSGPAAKVGRIEEQAYLVDVPATALMHLTGQLDRQWELDGKPVGLKSSHQ